MCVGGGGGAAAAVLLHGWIATVFYTFSIRFEYVFYSRFFLQPLRGTKAGLGSSRF